MHEILAPPTNTAEEKRRIRDNGWTQHVRSRHIISITKGSNFSMQSEIPFILARVVLNIGFLFYWLGGLSELDTFQQPGCHLSKKCVMGYARQYRLVKLAEKRKEQPIQDF